ncbi:MAG TPA: DUF1631 family protein [Dongiaceae bacterium]|nr:DUF1631 family protein [Dongiaceae bacterium]
MAEDDARRDDGAPRIGARILVELLRLHADDPPTEKIKLVPARSKNAMAVLRDKLWLVQQTLQDSGLKLTAAGALTERCSDLQIPLPVAQPDWGLILMLDQLFDRLLASDGLDSQAVDWMASLRLPVIRYALQDYSFFFAPQNLVRRFLNQSYLSLLSSSHKSRQILRDALSQFIRRIQQDFRHDVSVFNSICIEAQSWFAGQDDRVGQIEEQLRSLESVRRKERVSEPRVVQTLNRVAAGKPLPRQLVEFLHGEWRKSLRLVSMREGEEGSTWKRQVRISESLVEFAQECVDAQGRDKHRSFYPVLMKNIRALLVSVNEDPAALEAALDPLELVLLALLNGASPEPVKVPALQQVGGQVTTVEVKQVSPRALAEIQALQTGDWVRIKTTDGSHELCRLTIKSNDDEPWVLVSQSGKTITKKTAFQLAQGLEGGVLDLIGRGQWWDERLDTLLADLHSRWQRRQAEQPKQPEPVVESRIDVLMKTPLAPPPPKPVPVAEPPVETPAATASVTASTLTPTEETTDAEDFLAPRPVSDAERNAALQAIDQLQVGGWILQQTSQGEERCKLAVRIRGGEKLVFVNRLGVKVLEIGRIPLAELLARGLVTVIDTGIKFNNTLERVVRSIQEDRKPPS